MSKAQTVPEIHPDVVLEALLAKGGRSQRLGNLQKVHDICRRQHSGSKDFSTSAIGRICEAEGVLKGRALYNAASDALEVMGEEPSGFPIKVKGRLNESLSFQEEDES